MKKLKLFILASLMIGALGVSAGCSEKSTLAKPTEVVYNVDNELSWAAVEDAKSYIVEIVSVETGEVQTLSAKRTSPKVNLGFLAQGDYEIRVRALGREAEDEGEWSDTIYFKKTYETGCVYSLINNETEYAISKFGEATGTIYIEDEYRGKPVTEISSRAFKGCSEIEKVYVGNNVKRIASNAFYNCKNLTGVYFEEKSALQSIGVGAFQSCGLLEEITIPAGVTTIEESSFAYCRSLKEIDLHEGITAIETLAFSECSGLTSVKIPDAVTILGNSIYAGCTGLQTITLGEGLTAINPSMFYGCTGLTTIHFPTKGNLKTIDSGAFAECTSLTSVKIPEGVTAIGNGAFQMSVDQKLDAEGNLVGMDVRSRLNSIDLPATVTSIGSSAFTGTKLYMDDYLAGEKLIYIDDWLVSAHGGLGDTIKRLSTEAKEEEFAGNNLDPAILFREDVRGIADAALSGLPYLEEVYLPASLEYIGAYAFYSSKNLDTVMAEPNSVVNIGKAAFAECGLLQYVVFGDGLKTIGDMAFYACTKLDNLTDNVIVPDTVQSIGNNVFYGTRLSEIPDKNGLIYVGNWIVDCHENQSRVTISEDAIGIATYAFANTAVSNITIPTRNKLTYIMRGAFYNCRYLGQLYLNRTNVKEIGDYAFYGCLALTKIELPTNLVSIGHSAFSKCAKLSEIDLSGKKLESIGNAAFFECTNLSTVKFGTALTSIGDKAFAKCDTLQKVAIPGTVKTLGASAFAQCKALENVSIGMSVETIGKAAFAKCEALKSVNIAAGVKNIGDYAFYGCKELLSVSVGEGLQTIGEHAFSGANKLEKIQLPSTLKTIKTQAFRSCASLTSVTIPASVETIEEHAFFGCVVASFYVEKGAVTNEWSKYWNSNYQPVAWGCYLLMGEGSVEMITISETTFSNTWSNDTFNAPQKTGGTFVGWATTHNGVVEYAAGEVVNAPMGTTLYAIWR